MAFKLLCLLIGVGVNVVCSSGARNSSVILTPDAANINGIEINITNGISYVQDNKWGPSDIVISLDGKTWGFPNDSITYFEFIINGEKDLEESMSFTLTLNTEDNFGHYVALDIFLDGSNAAISKNNLIYPWCDNSTILDYDSPRFPRQMGNIARLNKTDNGRVCDVGEWTPCSNYTEKSNFMLPKIHNIDAFPLRFKMINYPIYGWYGYNSITFNNEQQCKFFDSFPENGINIHYFANYGAYNITSIEILEEIEEIIMQNTTKVSSSNDNINVWQQFDVLLPVFVGITCYMIIPLAFYLIIKICLKSKQRVTCRLLKLFFVAFLDIVDVVTDIFAAISFLKTTGCGVTACAYSHNPGFGITLSIAAVIGGLVTIFKNLYLYFFIIKNADNKAADGTYKDDESIYGHTQSEYTKESLESNVDKLKIVFHDLPGLIVYTTYFIIAGTKIGIYPSPVTITAWAISCIDFVVVLILSKNKNDSDDKLCKNGCHCNVRIVSLLVCLLLFVACVYGLVFAFNGGVSRPVSSVDDNCLAALDNWEEYPVYTTNEHNIQFYIQESTDYGEPYLTMPEGGLTDCDIADAQWLAVGECQSFNIICQGFVQQINVCFDVCWW